MEERDCNIPANARILFKKEEILTAIEKCSYLISERLSNYSELTVVSIMEGGIPTAHVCLNFIKKFIKDINVFQISLKVCRTHSTSLSDIRLHINRKLLCQFKARKSTTFLIIDDMTDEGISLKAVYDFCKNYAPVDILTMVCVTKRKITLFPAQFSVFKLDYDDTEASSRWLFGFGMDYFGKYRDADFIAEITLK